MNGAWQVIFERPERDGAGQSKFLVRNYAAPESLATRSTYPCKNTITSPSLTMYSFPSVRTFAVSRAAA